MRIEGARIFIDEEAMRVMSAPHYHMYFVDCDFVIVGASVGMLYFINCVFDKCRFNISFQSLCDISRHTYCEGDCSFAVEAGAAQGVT